MPHTYISLTRGSGRERERGGVEKCVYILSRAKVAAVVELRREKRRVRLDDVVCCCRRRGLVLLCYYSAPGSVSVYIIYIRSVGCRCGRWNRGDLKIVQVYIALIYSLYGSVR